MSLSIVQMEKNDGVANFIEACNDQSVAYFCLMHRHRIIEDLGFVEEYFEEPMIGLLYYNYIDKDTVKYFSSFSYSSIDFDKNIVVSRKAIDQVKHQSPKTFHNLIKLIVENGFMAINIPHTLTRFDE